METYGPGDDAAMFGRKLGLTRIGINYEVLSPGGQTAPPHAHEKDKEFVYVIDGTPDVWIDGNLYRLAPGDGVAFPNGTGIAHCFFDERLGVSHISEGGIAPAGGGAITFGR